MTTKTVNVLGCVASGINGQARTIIPVLDNIDAAAFDSMMNESLLQAKAGKDFL